jgi:hypothetical protein
MTHFATPYDYPRPTCPNEDSEMWPINAMRDAGVTLEVIDHQNMRVIFSNGVWLPIVAMFDADGFRVEEWDDCVTYDFGNSCVGYGAAKAAHDGVHLH